MDVSESSPGCYHLVGIHEAVRPFKDKSVLITGAGRGIGKRLAVGYAHAGARVGLLARTKAELDLANLEIEDSGGVAMRLRADVRNYEEVASAVERMRVQFGPPDVLVCAAVALGPVGELSTADPALWREAVDTNLLGAFHAARAVLGDMQTRRSGKILFLVDDGAEAGRPDLAAYAATKAALVRLAETLAEESRAYNIQVNCMHPGAAYTNLTDELLRSDAANSRERKEATRVRTFGGVPPDKQIQLAQFLTSERANHISGKLIYITDDWKRLELATLSPDSYTLRRMTRSGAGAPERPPGEGVVAAAPRAHVPR
jgi:NAD(P)-dependent dehydrogenase (short-subunit alcohol dehydrogenase family)